jgi:hypothetical protein
MTYETILDQISRNLGHETFHDNKSLISDYKYAVYQALMELTSGAGGLKEDVTIPLNEGTDTYILPDGYDKPGQINIVDSSGAAVTVEELDYDQVIETSLNETTESIARYSDRYVIGFRRSRESSEFKIYPTLTGIAYMTFDSLVQEDLDISHNKVPPINRKFHHNLVDGGTAYLLQRKVRITEDARDLILLKGFQKRFEKAKEDYVEFAAQRGDPPVIKVWNWYDQPEDYV